MRTSYRIFLNNKIDLDLYLKEVDQSFSEPSTTEWANRKKQGILITNIFNLLTSAQSLREVLREKNEKYCPIPTDSLIFYFYREIRNLIVHHCSFPLITKGKLKDEDGTRTFIYHQTIDKPVFLEFLNKKKEDFNKKGRHKQEDQIDLVVNFMANMADEIIFESLLLSYYESTIDFYKQWL